MSFEDIDKNNEINLASKIEGADLSVTPEKIEHRKAQDMQDAIDNIRHWDSTLKRIEDSGNKIEDKTSTAYEVNKRLAEAAQDKIDFYKGELERLQA